MKAIEALKQINAIFSDYVAIAKDANGEINVFSTVDIKPEKQDEWWYFKNFNVQYKMVSEDFANKIEWESDDWTKCIVTINDLKDEEP